MSPRIAIVGSSPTWRRGMASILEEAGFGVEDLGQLADWLPGIGGSAIVLHVDGNDDQEGLGLFAEEHPHIAVIAVVEELSLPVLAAVVRSGAGCVVADGDPPDVFASAVRSTIEGRPEVPQRLLRAMAELVPLSQDVAGWLSDDEMAWLRSMAGGATVAEIAEEVGYSERAMFRNLKSLYSRLGVANRTEALLWASRNGVLHSEP